jgi:hypothetical protein
MPHQSKPRNFIGILQSSGRTSTVQFHVISKGQTKPGINFSVPQSTHISPTLEIPKSLSKEKSGFLRKPFGICETDRPKETDILVLRRNEQKMMNWVLSVYLTIVHSQKRRNGRFPRSASIPATKFLIQNLPIAEPVVIIKDESSILTAIGKLNDIEASGPEFSEKFEQTKKPICPFWKKFKAVRAHGLWLWLRFVCCSKMVFGTIPNL